MDENMPIFTLVMPILTQDSHYHIKSSASTVNIRIMSSVLFNFKVFYNSSTVNVLLDKLLSETTNMLIVFCLNIEVTSSCLLHC
jgi:hypothetical protein